MKIRVPHNQILLETFKAWGANPVPMDWSETFTALQQGVVDGQENPYTMNYTAKLDEVQKYITEVHYQYSLQPLIYGTKSFVKLSPELQQILIQAGLEAQMFELLFQTLEAGKAKQAMQAAGVEVSTLTDEEAWKKAAIEQVWPKMYDFIGIADALAKGADTIITCGAVQSNHCRLTLSWAVKEGLDCHLVLEERVKGSYKPKGSGNNFLFHIMGVKSLTVVPCGSAMLDEMEKLAETLRKQGKKP